MSLWKVSRVGDLGIDTADGEVHLGQTPGRLVRFLAVDRDVTELPAVSFDEFLAADEHATRSAAGVARAALTVRAPQPARAPRRRRIELTPALTLGASEARKEVFIDATQHVLSAIGGAAERNVADQVDDLPEPLLVEPRPRKSFGNTPFRDGLSRSIAVMASSTSVPNSGLRRARFQVRPTCFLRHPEDIYGAVLVGVFGVGALCFLRFEFGVLRLEGIGDVLEEDQAENNMLVLRRVHIVTQRVGRRPEFLASKPRFAPVSLLVFC